MSVLANAVSVIVLATTFSIAADPARPKAEIRWHPPGGLMACSSAADLFWGTAAQPPHITTIWRWKEGNLTKVTEYPNGIDTEAVMPNDRIVGLGEKVDDRRPLLVKDIKQNRVLQRFAIEKGWWCSHTAASRNGQYLAIALSEDPTDKPPGFDWDRSRMRIYVLDETLREMRFACILGPKHVEGAVREIVVADDGSHVAIAGWDNGLAMIDVSAKKVLWEVRAPKDDAAWVNAAFAPDGKTIHCGGTAAAVYALDVTTGRILRRWFANDSGRPEFGWRIACISASPDGRFVVAGTGPAGVVYLARAKDGTLVRRIDHGLITIAMAQFSPDSRYLATLAGGVIKVWEMPEE